MKFRTKIAQTGGTTTGIEVPEKVMASLGEGKRLPVRVTINGHTYRSTIAVMRGKFMIALSGENRALAKVAGGDVVEVALEFDGSPREVSLPPDFARALKAEVRAKRFFDALSYSQKRTFVFGIETAKKPETRERRITAAVEMLRAGRAQR